MQQWLNMSTCRPGFALPIPTIDCGVPGIFRDLCKGFVWFRRQLSRADPKEPIGNEKRLHMVRTVGIAEVPLRLVGLCKVTRTMWYVYNLR
jgi:hypothetical protein